MKNISSNDHKQEQRMSAAYAVLILLRSLAKSLPIIFWRKAALIIWLKKNTMGRASKITLFCEVNSESILTAHEPLSTNHAMINPPHKPNTEYIELNNPNSHVQGGNA